MNQFVPTVKLQKVLAQANLGSRRSIEAFIVAGRVMVNGQVAQLGDRIDPAGTATVCLDGTPVKYQTAHNLQEEILLYYKPEGEIATRTDPKGRRTIFENLPSPKSGRWIMVGRLDINSSGLVLFTTDGGLANQLMHPRYEVEREYAVRLFGSVSDEMMQRLLQGIQLEQDGKSFLAKFQSIVPQRAGYQGSANQWVHVVIKEGRNREVRRLWESQGIPVSRLIRIRYGTITLPTQLRRGEWVMLSPTEATQLRSSLPVAVTRETRG